MAALHDALTSLGPVEWSEVPQDNLGKYLEDLLQQSELILSSVPPPPNGVPFADAKPQSTTPNTATSHKDMSPSEARSLPPQEEFEELQSQWGKPIKISAKENPLEVAVYKMAGKDRHGGWFARRSVHEGIGFTKFRDAMKAEFEHSLQVDGGPGAGCIRGIGADKKLEEHDVEGIGHLEVFQLSAQFPGPTTAREFIALVVTSESALSEKSVVKDGISTAPLPRHFIILSKPVKHPDAPERSGYVRGQYESVELIREIPLSRVKSKSTPNLLETAGKGDEPAEGEDAKPDLKRSKTDMPSSSEGGSDNDIDARELNPVEWIMVTRSDPGGGIPRFMIDRGTPSAMIGDLHKFLDWAAKSDAQNPADVAPVDGADVEKDAVPVATEGTHAETTESHTVGIFGHIAQTIEAGLDAYAPTMISSFVHNRLDRDDELDSDTSDESDTDSFTSATEKRHTAHEPLQIGSSESLSVASIAAPSEAGDKAKPLNHHEKKLLEINKERDKLEKRLAKKREEEETRLKKAQNDEESEATKAKERYEKEIQKQEEKHRKELAKLEAKKEKEARKLEQKRQKMLDRDALHKVTRERDEFRSQVDLLKKENEVLRQRIEHFESVMNSQTADESTT